MCSFNRAVVAGMIMVDSVELSYYMYLTQQGSQRRTERVMR